MPCFASTSQRPGYNARPRGKEGPCRPAERTPWAQYARVVRADILSLREREFVLAAKAAGASSGRVIFRHIVPKVLTFNLLGDGLRDALDPRQKDVLQGVNRLHSRRGIADARMVEVAAHLRWPALGAPEIAPHVAHQLDLVPGTLPPDRVGLTSWLRNSSGLRSGL